ncbi:DUF4175 family protein [Bradyrhizobium sp. STM 3809]|uniref:DUF4175 family protein n=1 Tax=Bradyrhizobium sp. STM 3809 TaxID=551936 RepID=UPI0002409EDB|nr:DUF4175 family protein [Bradyrhizobium sp. STM 3809]CCE03373.1 conserved exported hypothetical protein [Bradyrhizobium sp. STM 3809]
MMDRPIDHPTSQAAPLRVPRRRGGRALLRIGVLAGCCLIAAPAFADALDEYLDKAEQAMQDSIDSLKNKSSDESASHQSTAIRELERYLTGDLQQEQQALRDRLKQLQEQLAKRGMSPKGEKGQQGQKGQPGQQGEQGDPGDDGDQGDAGDGLDEADGAMGDAGSQLGDNNADGAVESQGKALDALRKGAQSLAQAMQQGDGDQPGDGPGQAPGRQAGAPPMDPLGRPLHGRDIDDFSQKIPGEIDVQRVRRILEELRRRSADPSRPQIELDYIERLLKEN